MMLIKNFGKISVFNDNIIDSILISKDKDKSKSIISWIKEKIKMKKIKHEKIFVMSLNGTSSQVFHNYCDNMGPTLTLVKTTKNKIFGGFTPLDWDSSGKSKVDSTNQTFIFSLNLMKKYDIITNEKPAIICNKNNGPAFGGIDFEIKTDMTKGRSFANQYANFLSDNNLELTGGKGNFELFDIEDFEVFKIIY